MSEFVVFVGAGASKPFGILTMTEMTEGFEKELKKSSLPGITLFDEIKRRLKEYQYFDIESLITVLQSIVDIDKLSSTVLNNPRLHYFFAERAVGGIGGTITDEKRRAEGDRAGAEELLKHVRQFIVDSCKMQEKPFELYDELFDYANKNHRPTFKFKDVTSRRGFTIPNHQVFTTNYDLVLEGYCQYKEFPEWTFGQLPTGQLNIVDNLPLYSSDRTIFQIYKLHGSVNWYLNERGVMSWLSGAAQAGQSTLAGQKIAKELLIYPAFEKYTFREPFYNMFHHLKKRLLRCQGCYVVGYSFRDDDILGLFHDAMELNGDLQLYLIDRKAQNIVEEKFKSFLDRIKTIPKEFSIEAVSELA